MGSCIEGQLFGVHQRLSLGCEGLAQGGAPGCLPGHEQTVRGAVLDHAYTAIQKCKADFNQNVSSQQAAQNICYYGD